jgi:DNA modification methylase
MPAESVHCCVTSPPYWGLRDYNVDGQLGLESTPEEYVAKMVGVFREVRRVLRDDGTLWLNLGDSYAGTRQTRKRGADFDGRESVWRPEDNRPAYNGLRAKNLVGIPWRVAFALQADGWWLRSDIIWHKPNPMPESVRDRPTKAHEYLFLLSKSARYWYDAEAVKEASHDPASYKPRTPRNADKREGDPLFATKVGDHANGKTYPTRNRRTVWKVATQPFRGAHFATFPPKLIEPCILAGCPEGGTILDPFGGAGTTGLVAAEHGREYLLIELNPEYVEMARNRLAKYQPVVFGAGGIAE